MNLLYISIALTVFSVAGLVATFLLTRTARAKARRVFEATRGTKRKQPVAQKRMQLQKLLFSGVSWVRMKVGLTEDIRLRDRFALAGFRDTLHAEAYLAARLVGPLAAVLIGFLLPSNHVFWMMTVGGIFYLAPDILLERAIRQRRQRIRNSIPDAIDLLVICVDAGLGMDQAMLRVGEELEISHPQIYEEFLQINREQRAGKLRIEAWEGLAERSKLPEIKAFVNMLMQTERFGTPIARALSSFADGIRQRRKQKAEEMAAKTTVKIIFPLVLFIFPSLFVVLLGPAAINISRGLVGIAQ